jgi:hypothetical protein
MKPIIYIPFAILFLSGALKMFVFNVWFQNKLWFNDFNFWYGKWMILATFLFVAPGIKELVKFLFQKKENNENT